MLALSIKQPWADALVGGRKSIEIRGWRPPRHAIGQTIAIHAGKLPDRHAPLRIMRLRTREATVPAHERCGGVIGVARLIEARTYAAYSEWLRDLALHLNEPEWFEVGLVGWVFDGQIGFERAIPSRGQLGLFDLPLDIEAAVRNLMMEKG